VTNTDACVRHPWLRINRALRVMLHTRWSASATAPWGMHRQGFDVQLTQYDDRG